VAEFYGYFSLNIGGNLLEE